MDRPSLLDATARKEHGKVTEVSVGGRATIIGHGIITIPRPGTGQTERAADWVVGEVTGMAGPLPRSPPGETWAFTGTPCAA